MIEDGVWYTIEEKPIVPCVAVLWYPDWYEKDRIGRYDIGVFTGDRWLHQDSGHDVMIDAQYETELPTHWCKFPKAPIE